MEKSFLVSSCFIWLSGLMSALSLDLREEEESLSCDNVHNERKLAALWHLFETYLYICKNDLKGGSQDFPDDTIWRLWPFIKYCWEKTTLKHTVRSRPVRNVFTVRGCETADFCGKILVTERKEQLTEQRCFNRKLNYVTDWSKRECTKLLMDPDFFFFFDGITISWKGIRSHSKDYKL